MKLWIQTLLKKIHFIISVAIFAFGEEIGWRAYVLPILIKLMNKQKAILLNGVLWGWGMASTYGNFRDKHIIRAKSHRYYWHIRSSNWCNHSIKNKIIRLLENMTY
ncbi:hypothetical protein CULT_590029 [[Clostridium] ultunense Esp]|uniref:CPBP family intramembrane glutamic endopeptidase n=1 Tax=Schnuerera ultunensis TaxID=45497 RepID=UPI0002B6F84C|nr:hypothetical protein CULT_590029 [[Clostridium] ultunense Esp]